MKAALFLLLALGAAFASACADYTSACQCVGSDAKPNNTATDLVCNSMNSGQIISYGGYDQCWHGEVLNNCRWDDFCALAKGGTYSECTS